MQAPTQRRTRVVDQSNLRPYFDRILQQVHPTLRISRPATDTLNQIMGNLTRDITQAGIKVVNYERQSTLFSQEIQLAIQILFPDQIAQQAITNGISAVQAFGQTQPPSRRTTRAPSTIQASSNVQPVTSDIQSIPTTSDIQADGTRVTRERRANITVSVSRIEAIIRSVTDPLNLRVGQDAIVYVAAVINYISTEVLGLAGNVAIDNNRSILYSTDIVDAIYNDPELRHIFADWLFQQIPTLTHQQSQPDEEATYEEVTGEASEETPRT